MNDEELITLVREQRTAVPMTTPVDDIISRGRAVRTRRRIPALAGALAMVGGTAVTVTALASGAPQATPGPQLAAWTVTRQADGDVRVTIRELLDPAGLQAKLRADGVPAAIDVKYSNGPHSVCRPYPVSSSQFGTIIQYQSSRGVVIVIDPSAIPPGVGVALSASHVYGDHNHQAHTLVGTGLVYAGKQCTGG
ncbi:MAG: hypothetical protein ACRDOD_21845 [Streptosporangiaceae bacterium]